MSKYTPTKRTVALILALAIATSLTVLVGFSPPSAPILGSRVVFGDVSMVVASYEIDNVEDHFQEYTLKEHDTERQYILVFSKADNIHAPDDLHTWNAARVSGNVVLVHAKNQISYSLIVEKIERLKHGIFDIARANSSFDLHAIGDDMAYIVRDGMALGNQLSNELEVVVTRTIACIIVDFTDTTSLFDATIFTNMFWDGAKNVDQLFEASSFGQARLARMPQNIYGPYTIAYSKSDGCTYTTIQSLADQALANAGVDKSQFQHMVYGLPADADCGWAGLASVGCVQSGNQCKMWLKSSTPNVAAHELGHNFGLRHASVEDPFSEYGDYSCTMGIGCSCNWGHRQFSTPHVLAGGWISSGTQVKDLASMLTTTGSVDIDVSAIEVDNAPHPYAYRFPTQASPGAGDSYYVSYRTNQKQDTYLYSTYLQKTNIHRMASSSQTYFEKALDDTQSWTGRTGDPSFTITQKSHTSDKATITVSGCFQGGAIVVDPQLRMIKKGQSGTFNIRVYNSDTPSCGSSARSFQPTTTESTVFLGPASWSPSTAQNIAPGSYYDFVLTMPVPNYSNSPIGTTYHYEIVAGGSRAPFGVKIVATATPTVTPTPIPAPSLDPTANAAATSTLSPTPSPTQPTPTQPTTNATDNPTLSPTPTRPTATQPGLTPTPTQPTTNATANPTSTPTPPCTYDCLGILCGTATYDCDNVCNGGKVFDCWGICDGNGKTDCAGVCGGAAVYDSCGVCGGSGSCTPTPTPTPTPSWDPTQPTPTSTPLLPVSWRWLSGSSVLNQVSVCGTSGQYSSTYSPGSRSSTSMTDASTASGNVEYLFGGSGYHSAGSSAYLGDMWGYRQTEWSGIGEWAWLGGKSNEGGYNGAFYSSTKYPGARYAPVSWLVQGSPNRVFIFGGYGFPSTGSGYLNDVWSFDVSSGTWSYVKGASFADDLSVPGTMGTPAAANTPGGMSLQNMLSSKSDGTETLIFGGEGYFTSTTLARHADVWRYNSQSNEWTWINGPTAFNTNSVGGSSGVYSSSFRPSARYRIASMDTTHRPGSSIIYVFGGNGLPSVGTTVGLLADLWAYDKAISQWAYIAGDSMNINAVGSYGTLGFFNASNHPGSRQYSGGWSDPNSDHLVNIFGGYGYDQSGLGFLNDFWSFNTSLNLWSWAGGDFVKEQASAFAGAVGSWFSTSNNPGKRHSHSSAVNHDLGLMYMFGGDFVGYGNELWTTKGPTVIVGVSPTASPTASPVPTPTPLFPIAWRWLTGSSVTNQNSVCGTVGQYSSSYSPGSRWMAAMTVASTASGNVAYVFGGVGSAGRLGDLWGYRQTEWSGIGDGSQIECTLTPQLQYAGEYSKQGDVSGENLGLNSDYVCFLNKVQIGGPPGSGWFGCQITLESGQWKWYNAGGGQSVSCKVMCLHKTNFLS